jgi:hypothetical protein
MFDDLQISFKRRFELFDLALNDSTIRPLNLGRPRNRRSQAAPRDREAIRLAPSRSENVESVQATKQLPPMTQPSGFVSAPTPSLPPNTAVETLPCVISRLSEPTFAQIPMTIEDMFHPVPENCRVSFDIRISSDKGNRMEIADVVSNEILLSVTREGKIGSCTIKIHAPQNESQIYSQIHSNFIHSHFHATTRADGTNKEIAAIHFKTQNRNSGNQRRLTAYIPKCGVAVPAGDASEFLKHKELGMKMFEKPPKLKGGVPVLYFGGRVKLQSVKNHILVSEDAAGHLLVFGKAAAGVFVADVFPPLAPLQAVCLALPHLT